MDLGIRRVCHSGTLTRWRDVVPASGTATATFQRGRAMDQDQRQLCRGGTSIATVWYNRVILVA